VKATNHPPREYPVVLPLLASSTRSQLHGTSYALNITVSSRAIHRHDFAPQNDYLLPLNYARFLIEGLDDYWTLSMLFRN